MAQFWKPQENQGFSDNKKSVKRVKTEKEYFSSKQRSKALGFATAKRLFTLDSPLHNQYKNGLSCNSIITKEDDKIKSVHCKLRFCVTCNRIRTAKLMNTYLPIISHWENIHFITLTIPNITGNELRDSIIQMEHDFIKIIDVLRKRGKPLKAVRKTEVTYNPDKKNFHPHFHLIVEGNRTDLIEEWLKHCKTSDIKGQNIKPANEKSAKELFKYFSKVIFKGQFLPVQIDIIFQSVTKKRTFHSYGIKLSDQQKQLIKDAETIDRLESQALTTNYYQSKSNGEYTWLQSERTWIHETGEILHPYKPLKRLEKLITKIAGTDHLEPDHLEPDHREPDHLEPDHREPDHLEPDHREPG